jgi:hypothetical protein
MTKQYLLGQACVASAFAAATFLSLAATPAVACDFWCLTARQEEALERDRFVQEQSEIARQNQEAEMAARAAQEAELAKLPPRPDPYSAIAFHPDANDVWVAAMYPDAFSAKTAARDRCSEVMGEGCETTWQGKGYLGAARGPNGFIYWTGDGSKAEVKKYLDKWCAQISPLGCTPLGIYHSDSEFRRNRSRTGPNIRDPKDLQMIKKRYAAVSHMADGSYDRKSWIATGYATQKEAENVALSICQIRSKESKKCSVGSSTGNGVIAAYSDGKIDAFLVEQSEVRARQAVAAQCKKQGITCKVHSVYDARTTGTFENIMQ